MREFLLSMASPESLSWIGFVIFALALLGEIGVFLLPQRWNVLRGALVVIFAGAVLAGHLINHMGDDEIAARFEARATAAEKELKALKGSQYPLTNEQRDRLTKVLEAIPINERFQVTILWPQINGVQRYANELQQVFSSAKWDARVSAAGLTFGHGISIAISQRAYDGKTKRPQEAVKLMGLLDQAGIHYDVAPWTNIIVPYAFIVGAAE